MDLRNDCCKKKFPIKEEIEIVGINLRQPKGLCNEKCFNDWELKKLEYIRDS